jgi:hypothetical protein
MKDELATAKDLGWYYYAEIGVKKNPFSESDNVGKFMTFGKGEITDETQALILKAIEQGATPLVKHTNPSTVELNPYADGDSWVIVWYSTDEKESLKKLASFLTENGLIPKTKAGRYYNISFKYDNQTQNGEYGEAFKAAIKLEDLMDLNTGLLL